MKMLRTLCSGLAVIPLLTLLTLPGSGVASASAAEPTPVITAISQPQAGDMQILFHGGTGPFTVQKRLSLDANAPWLDIPAAKVTSVNTGVYVAWIPMGNEDAAFYRVVSAGETIVELKGWTLGLKVSAPGNGTHFVAGERPVVTVSILDNFAQGLNKTSFSSLALYMYGPDDPERTITAWKLLNASTNRSASVHHYIDLKTNAGVTTNGNTLTYTLQPVTDEAPGTYTIAVRSVLSADGMQQIMKYATVQIGTSVVESKVIANAKCAECHQGTVSGKMYMHHADVSSRSAFGSWIYDLEPDKSCKVCHNNEGYAAYTHPFTGQRVPDPLVIRAHGVHNGVRLANTANTDPEDGIFADYTHVYFPADIRNCTACHADDRWKTHPSTLACGACHDNVWFGDLASMPTNMVAHAVSEQDPQGVLPVTGTACTVCHKADAPGFGPAVSVAHAIPPITREFDVELALSAPGNGQYFVAGEAPDVLIKVKDKATGLYVDPALISDGTPWNRALLLVAGPRSDTMPVLTPAGLTNTSGSYAQNDWRIRTNAVNNDPQVVGRTADTVSYRLYPITNLNAGTYTVYAEVRRASTGNYSIGKLNFQVGTATVEALPATSCADCHAQTVIHSTSRALAYSEVDLCKACHDYKRQDATRTSWTSGQYGFRVGPLSRRVHGIHYGRYVHKPQEIQSQDYSEVIFPMDVRNCTKCHSETSSWKEKPGRLACFSCHDSDDALMHGRLMTYDPTPTDPWNGDEWETCASCHGKGTEFSADKVHSISNPYVPPYPREPAE